MSVETNKTLHARRRSRERDVPVGAHTYTVRRPKVAEMLEGMTRIELARRYTVGWSLSNLDLVPGGTPDPEPFDLELWSDWLEDDETLWEPLSNAILALLKEHQEAKAAAAKN